MRDGRTTEFRGPIGSRIRIIKPNSRFIEQVAVEKIFTKPSNILAGVGSSVRTINKCMITTTWKQQKNQTFLISGSQCLGHKTTAVWTKWKKECIPMKTPPVQRRWGLKCKYHSGPSEREIVLKRVPFSFFYKLGSLGSVCTASNKKPRRIKVHL